MSLPIITRWLRRPLIGAALLATGMLAAGGAAAPAEAQYYPYYAYNPYYSPYCNPYYNPYACPAAYGYPGYGYGYGYPYYGYGAAALVFIIIMGSTAAASVAAAASTADIAADLREPQPRSISASGSCSRKFATARPRSATA